MASKAPPPQTQCDEIKRWRITAHSKTETSSTAIIASLYNGLIAFLKLVLQDVQTHKPEPHYARSLEDSVAALFFWGRDLDVSQGDLDLTLQYSHRLRDTLLTLLVSLGDLLSHGLVCILPNSKELRRVLDSSCITTLVEQARVVLEEPSGSTNFDGYDVEDLCSILKTKIGNLSVLSSSLETPAEDEFDDEEARTWVQLRNRSAHEYFADLVSARFPHADQRIIAHLGQSNWDRYNYVQKLRESVQDDPESEVLGADKAKSEPHDSGIGTSAPAQPVFHGESSQVACAPASEYAATVVSSRAEASHKRMPPLPAQARSGETFQCEVCNRKLNIRRRSEWKKHIFEDICAYTCIFPECLFTRIWFKDRQAMTDHLRSQHGLGEDTSSQKCPLCFESVYRGLSNISLHFARHMEEIALGILPQGAESEESSNESKEKLGTLDQGRSPSLASSSEKPILLSRTPSPDSSDSIDDNTPTQGIVAPGSITQQGEMKQLTFGGFQSVPAAVEGDLDPFKTPPSRIRSRQELKVLQMHGLQAWLDANNDSPYPDAETKRLLAQETGLTEKQVNTWFTNARARQPIDLQAWMESENAAHHSSGKGNYSDDEDSDGSIIRIRPASRRGKKKDYRKARTPIPLEEEEHAKSPKTFISEEREIEMWQCTFCRRKVVPKSWRRHEETQHRPRAQWICMPDGPRVAYRGVTTCAFCMEKDPSEKHFLTTHRIEECAKRNISDRTFFRPDHLRQHMKNIHGASVTDTMLARWKKTAETAEEHGWICGFCDAELNTWDQRETHIAHHFKEGLTMVHWKNCAEERITKK